MFLKMKQTSLVPGKMKWLHFFQFFHLQLKRPGQDTTSKHRKSIPGGRKYILSEHLGFWRITDWCLF